MGFLQRMLDEGLTIARNGSWGDGACSALIRCNTARDAPGIIYGMLGHVRQQQRPGESRTRSRPERPGSQCHKVGGDGSDAGCLPVPLQLVGAKGYRLDHIAGRATVDSRPFQIFEGSNDILYQQIAEAVLKLMRSQGEEPASVSRWLRTHFPGLGIRAGTPGFRGRPPDPQRKLVNLGRPWGVS